MCRLLSLFLLDPIVILHPSTLRGDRCMDPAPPPPQVKTPSHPCPGPPHTPAPYTGAVRPAPSNGSYSWSPGIVSDTLEVFASSKQPLWKCLLLQEEEVIRYFLSKVPEKWGRLSWPPSPAVGSSRWKQPPGRENRQGLEVLRQVPHGHHHEASRSAREHQARLRPRASAPPSRRPRLAHLGQHGRALCLHSPGFSCRRTSGASTELQDPSRSACTHSPVHSGNYVSSRLFYFRP